MRHLELTIDSSWIVPYQGQNILSLLPSNAIIILLQNLSSNNILMLSRTCNDINKMLSHTLDMFLCQLALAKYIKSSYSISDMSLLTRIRKYHPNFSQLSYYDPPTSQLSYYDPPAPQLSYDTVSPIWSEEEIFDLNDTYPDPDDFDQQSKYALTNNSEDYDERSDYANMRPKWLDQSDGDVPFYWS